MAFDISLIQQIREGIQKNDRLMCFSIGATYLQEKYLAEARGTNDIDFIVVHKGKISNTKLDNLIIEQMQALNCQTYSESNNPLRFKTSRNVKVHIYTNKIGDFEISEGMIKRVDSNHQLSSEDFVFLKLLPGEREKDRSDIAFVLKASPDFKWEILFLELKTQLEAYEKKFGVGSTFNKVVEIGYTLEAIRDEHPDLVTQKSIDSITHLLNFYNSRP